MRFRFSWARVLVTLNTFSISFVCALAVAGLAIRANHNNIIANQERFDRTLITMGIFIPLMVIVERWTALSRRTNLRVLGIFSVIILALLYYLFRVPHMSTTIMQDGYAIQIALHAFITRGMLIRLIPVLMEWDIKSTWMHTYHLAIESVITIIFCGVLFGGLAAALSAIDYLFGINIPGELYFDLWAVIVGVFGGLFWLSHLTLNQINYTYTNESFPKVLRIFAEYILGFLLIVYAVILLAYTTKISISGVWPDGMVAGLIFGFLAMGTVYTTILIPRIIEGSGSRLHTRILGLLFVGAAILLVSALQQRVTMYGWTVERAMIILVAIWAVLISGSMLIAQPSISYRLISGAIIGIVGYYAPVNIFSYAQNDQILRLATDLQKVQFSMATKKADATLITEDVSFKVSDRVQYLLRYHGTKALEQFTPNDVLYPTAQVTSGEAERVYYRSLAERIVTSRGFTYAPYAYYTNEDGTNVRYFSFNGTYPRSITVKGYKDMAFIHSYQDPTNIEQPQTVGTTSINATPTSPIYKVDIQDRSISIRGSQPQTISLDPFIKKALSSSSVVSKEMSPQDAMLMTGDTYALYLLNINGTIEKKDGQDVTIINNFEGILLIR